MSSIISPIKISRNDNFIDHIYYYFIPVIRDNYSVKNIILNLINLSFLPFFFIFIKLHKKRNFLKFNVIHVNDSVLIIPGLIIKLITKSSLVVHCRSVINSHGFTNLILKFFGKYVDKFICIDEYVRSSLCVGSNYLDSKIIIVRNFHSGLHECNKKYSGRKVFNIGFCAALMESKGIFKVIDAIICLRNECNLQVNLIIAGEDLRKTNSFFKKFFFRIFNVSHNIEDKINQMLIKNDNEKYVKFMGYVKNLENFYQNIDVNIFSSNLGSYGRSVIEAGYFAVPSIINLPDYDKSFALKDNINCLVIKDNDHRNIKLKIKSILNNKIMLNKLKINTKSFFDEYHSPDFNTKKVIEIYNDISKQYLLRKKL